MIGAVEFEHEFAGTIMCRACHGRPPGNNPYEDWAGDAHARAFKSLATDAAAAAGKKRGVSAPQKAPQCLKCHATAYGFSENQVTDMVELAEGVACESCHGPGMDYMPMEIMQDRERALEEGLILSDKKICMRCHNEESPFWKADRYTLKDGTKTGFDFVQALAKLAHPRPAEDAGKAAEK
jgi:hypothetical protein